MRFVLKFFWGGERIVLSFLFFNLKFSVVQLIHFLQNERKAYIPEIKLSNF